VKASVLALVSCSAYSSTLKMEAIFSFETSVDFQRTTQRYIPGGSTLHNHRCENLKSYKEKYVPMYIMIERISVRIQSKDERDDDIRVIADLTLGRDIDCSGLMCSLISLVLPGLYNPE
jgi:hypothetical protein